MTEPTITVIKSTEHWTDYRIEGGDIHPDWAAKAKRIGVQKTLAGVAAQAQATRRMR